MGVVLGARQKHFYNYSVAPINIAHGSVRSGKTFISNLKWLSYVKNGPPGKLLMSGRTKDSLRENVLNDIFDIVGEANYDYKERTGELTLFDRKIEVRGAEKIDAEYAIRGRTYAGWYGDEITIQHKAFVSQAVARCSIPGSQLFWTTNPDHPDHYILTDFIKSETQIKEDMVRSWHFKLTDNKTLSPEYLKLLDQSFAGVFHDRMIKGLWVIATGVVYAKYYNAATMRLPHDQILQMCREKKFVTYLAGTDWGWSHPMVGLIIGVTMENKYYVVAEYYKTEKLTEDLADWYLSWESFLGRKIEAIYCDSAEPDRINIMRGKGLNAAPAEKAITSGNNTVMTTLKNGNFFISDAAINTHSEFGKYRYPDSTTSLSVPRDKPLDTDNHAMDALRYVIHKYELYLNRLYLAQQAKERRKNKRKGDLT